MCRKYATKTFIKILMFTEALDRTIKLLFNLNFNLITQGIPGFFKVFLIKATHIEIMSRTLFADTPTFYNDLLC